MPVYEAQCSKCNTIHEFIEVYENRDNTPKCCGKRTVRGVFTPIHVNATLKYGYTQGKNIISMDEGRQEAEHQKKQREAAYKKNRRAEIERVVRQATNS
jgi:hypothetical protein